MDIQQETIDNILSRLVVKLEGDLGKYGFAYNKENFASCINKVNKVYDDVAKSADIDYIINKLEMLVNNLEAMINRPKVIDKSRLDENGKLKIINVVRSDIGLDDWIRDKILPVVQPAIEDLNKLRVKPKGKKNYVEYPWFKIGLLFATGKMNDLLEKHNNNTRQIAKEIGTIEGWRPYISATFNKDKSDKNIYSSISKMQKINDYCEEQGIAITPQFKGKLKKLQSK